MDNHCNNNEGESNKELLELINRLSPDNKNTLCQLLKADQSFLTLSEGDEAWKSYEEIGDEKEFLLLGITGGFITESVLVLLGVPIALEIALVFHLVNLCQSYKRFRDKTKHLPKSVYRQLQHRLISRFAIWLLVFVTIPILYIDWHFQDTRQDAVIISSPQAPQESPSPEPTSTPPPPTKQANSDSTEPSLTAVASQSTLVPSPTLRLTWTPQPIAPNIPTLPFPTPVTTQTPVPETTVEPTLPVVTPIPATSIPLPPSQTPTLTATATAVAPTPTPRITLQPASTVTPVETIKPTVTPTYSPTPIEPTSTPSPTATPTLTSTWTPTPPPSACIPKFNFEEDAQGNPLVPGQIIDDEWSTWGVTVATNDPLNHPIMVFGSDTPTGGDFDLGTPNEDFGGPGIGEGGGAGQPGENAQARHHVLIISEDGDPTDPDDAANGGMFIFTFAQPVSVDSLGLLDMETGNPPAVIRAYDASGKLIGSWVASSLGDNSFQRVFIKALFVSRLEVEFYGSGALTDIIFCEE